MTAMPEIMLATASSITLRTEPMPGRMRKVLRAGLSTAPTIVPCGTCIVISIPTIRERGTTTTGGADIELKGPIRCDIHQDRT